MFRKWMSAILFLTGLGLVIYHQIETEGSTILGEGASLITDWPWILGAIGIALVVCGVSGWLGFDRDIVKTLQRLWNPEQPNRMEQPDEWTPNQLGIKDWIENGIRNGGSRT